MAGQLLRGAALASVWLAVPTKLSFSEPLLGLLDAARYLINHQTKMVILKQLETKSRGLTTLPRARWEVCLVEQPPGGPLKAQDRLEDTFC